MSFPDIDVGLAPPLTSVWSREQCTVSFHNSKSQKFKLSVSNPKSKYVVHLSVLSQISNCQSLGRKNKHEILKTDRTANLRTHILDVSGSDSSIIWNLRCGIRMPIGNPRNSESANLRGDNLSRKIGRSRVRQSSSDVAGKLWLRCYIYIYIYIYTHHNNHDNTNNNQFYTLPTAPMSSATMPYKLFWTWAGVWMSQPSLEGDAHVRWCPNNPHRWWFDYCLFLAHNEQHMSCQRGDIQDCVWNYWALLLCFLLLWLFVLNSWIYSWWKCDTIPM